MNAIGAKLDAPERLGPAAILGTDFWRLAPGDLREGDKEWSHFNVLAPGLDFLANFNLTAQRDRSGTVAARPRLAVLVRDAAGVWDGDVETFPLEGTAISAGSVGVAMGRNCVRFAQGRYRLRIALSAREVEAELELRPTVFPLVATNVALSDAESFSWAVVPGLVADGHVTLRRHRVAVRGAPAYHDRNWGRFAWGGGYSWEWATVHPREIDEPWRLVYSRVTDRLRSTTLSQSVLLWHGDRLWRKFYGRDLRIRPHGVVRRARPFRIPPAAALALPGSAADIPGSLAIDARAYSDTLSVNLSFDDFAQIVVPNDRFPGLTALSEIPGRAVVSGRIGHERLDFEGRVQAEINHAA